MLIKTGLTGVTIALALACGGLLGAINGILIGYMRMRAFLTTMVTLIVYKAVHDMLNFKLVADLPLSEQVKSMGQEANYMRILAFCDAVIAKQMVEFDIIFAGFKPRLIFLTNGLVGQACLQGSRKKLFAKLFCSETLLRQVADALQISFRSRGAQN